MMTLASSSFCNSPCSLIHFSTTTINPCLHNFTTLSSSSSSSSSRKGNSLASRRLRIVAATEGSAEKSKEKEEDPSVPTWAKPGTDEPPPWARNESQKDSSSVQVPFIVYLLASAVTAIAAIGSIFEYSNQKPVFGVLGSDSVFYAPLLGFFVFTGIPTSAFLWFKAVQVANKEAEEQDRRDGYM
ncbi:putative vacuolar iron transporter -like protein 4-like [Capsicum annuum]|nr:putative vacuolar iron transporter -like protein 4-like [Capsicum annuum]